MKIFVPMILALLLLPTSCAQKDAPWTEDLQKKAADTIRGFYTLENCRWEGPAIDMDGDGIQSEDFTSEWTRTGMGSHTSEVQATVERPDFAGGEDLEKFKFNVRLPFQKVIWDEEGEGFNSMGGIINFTATYSIDQKGQLKLDPRLERNTWETSRYEDFNRGARNISLIQPAYARLQAVIEDYPVYDHVSQEFINARLTINLKRESYR